MSSPRVGNPRVGVSVSCPVTGPITASAVAFFLHRVLFTQTSTSAVPHSTVFLITFRVRRNRGEMYIGHGRLCVCVCVCLSVCLSLTAFLQYCTNPGVTWRNGRGCPLVGQYWAVLQSAYEREISASACTRSMPGCS